MVGPKQLALFPMAPNLGPLTITCPVCKARRRDPCTSLADPHVTLPIPHPLRATAALRRVIDRPALHEI